MDIGMYLQRFESTMALYTGDDPLDAWETFVNYLEQNIPSDKQSGMSLVFETLIQRFLKVERYSNDARYVNYCIKYAKYYTDPVLLYDHIFSKGIGTRTAIWYVAWAQQLEQKGMTDRAEAVYRKALENQAQPGHIISEEYRQFVTRTKGHNLAPAGGRNPLQSSSLVNQPVGQVSVDCPSKPLQKGGLITTISRSENVGVNSSQGNSVQTVSMYDKEALVCEGSEYCFEEVRAAKIASHFPSVLVKLNESCQKSNIQTTSLQPPALEATGSVTPNLPQVPFEVSQPSNILSSWHSVGLRLRSEVTPIQEATAAFPERLYPQQSDINPLSLEAFHQTSLPADSSLPFRAPASEHLLTQIQETSSYLQTPDAGAAANTSICCQDAGAQPNTSDKHHSSQDNQTDHDICLPPEQEDKVDGNTANLSHVTPNTSLGYVQATPSRVLPSPTVNTREALGLIMDMFQAPTFLEEQFDHKSMLHTVDEEESNAVNDVSMISKPPVKASFTIFQDEDNKENSSAAAPSERSKQVKTLSDITASKSLKQNETPPDLMPDESTMWGARYNSLHSLAACPNSTTDFAMLAQFVSTPSTHKSSGLCNRDAFQEQENCVGGAADNEVFTRCQTKKLSPIIEQSPADETMFDSTVGKQLPSSARQGTIVGECLASATHCLTSSSSSSMTLVQPPPPAVLSFRDQTLCPTDSSRTAKLGWEVYESPEQPSKHASSFHSKSQSEAFHIMEDVDRPDNPDLLQRSHDPMSSSFLFKSDWMSIKNPQPPVESDLDVCMSPRRPLSEADGTATANQNVDVPMSPEQSRVCADVPMSPTHVSAMDEPMMSPAREFTSRIGTLHLVSDPWNDELISHLLSNLSPPLPSHPRCITWQCSMPNISPKMTISMGRTSLHIDSIVGTGAFATVYQVTDPATSERKVLKVQKPANPWEFYINTRLDSLLRPDLRHLYSRINSAHLFQNGSVMLSELHNYGTLLNAVNLYKTQSNKVMPQPLAMYFTICILHMVEQLHSVGIIHADIKPDNFMLGERFLENKSFDSENLNHGLVLIDLGQSIDMELFPQGTAFTAKCMTSGFQCTEMLSGKPWNYQTDYFGLAGTVHCMLFGTYMQVSNEGGVWKTNGVFRRNPHSELWQDFFHTLLNVPDCNSLPSLQSLRQQLTAVLQENYENKLGTMKSRLLVLLLEDHRAARR